MPNGDDGGFLSSIKRCSQRRGCTNTLFGTWSVNREISFSSQECVQGGILEPDLWITLVGKAMLNSFPALQGQGLGMVPSVQGCSAWGWSSSCFCGEWTQRCDNIQDKDPLLLSFPGVTGKSIRLFRCSVRGLRPLFTILPKVFREGCRLKLLLQCLETQHYCRRAYLCMRWTILTLDTGKMRTSKILCCPSKALLSKNSEHPLFR